MTYNLYWYGMLTTGNVERVAGLMSELLDGKFYTTITAHPVAYQPGVPCQEKVDVDCRMDVRTSQKLSPEGTRSGKAITWSVEDNRAHMTLYDSYGLYCLDSKLTGDRVPSDGSYQNPYFVFKGNQVTIWHRAPAGNLLVWTFAVEDHSE